MTPRAKKYPVYLDASEMAKVERYARKYGISSERLLLAGIDTFLDILLASDADPENAPPAFDEVLRRFRH